MTPFVYLYCLVISQRNAWLLRIYGKYHILFIMFVFKVHQHCWSLLIIVTFYCLLVIWLLAIILYNHSALSIFLMGYSCMLVMPIVCSLLLILSLWLLFLIDDYKCYCCLPPIVSHTICIYLLVTVYPSHHVSVIPYSYLLVVSPSLVIPQSSSIIIQLVARSAIPVSWRAGSIPTYRVDEHLKSSGFIVWPSMRWARVPGTLDPQPDLLYW